MKKFALIFSLIFVTGLSFAKVDDKNTVSGTGWGSTSVPNKNFRDSKNEGINADDFIINKYKVDVGKDPTHSGDSAIAFVAVKVAPNGGCFKAVDLHCEHKEGDGWSSYLAVFDAKNTPGSGCTWLCADGYAGEGCTQAANGSTKTEWWGLSASQRDALDFPGGKAEIYDNLKKTATEIQNMALFDAKINGGSGTTYSAYTFLGITNYLSGGVKASPITFSCVVERPGGAFGWLYGFKGANNHIGKIGNTKLLCPMGYVPNAAKTDCEEFVVATSTTSTTSSSSNADNAATTSTGTTREITVDGSIQEFSDTKQISQIEALKSQPGYDSSIHSVYDYNQSSTNPKFAVFCKDTSTGLASTSSLKCIDCTSNMRRGVCLTRGNAGFGVCVQCSVGKVYNSDLCRCVDAAAYSMNDLAWGKGKSIGDYTANSSDACWAKDSEDEYKECVGVGTVTKVKNNSTSNSGSNGGNNITPDTFPQVVQKENFVRGGKDDVTDNPRKINNTETPDKQMLDMDISRSVIDR